MMYVHIAKPTEVLWSGEAVSLTAPAVEGEVTILPKHEAYVSALKKGRVTVRTKEESKEFDIQEGILEVSSRGATILV